MSIDRCRYAYEIIESKFAGGYEKVTGQEPEQDGIFVVTARAATYQRASELRSEVVAALGEDGFDCIAPVPETFRDGGELRASLSFRVKVGEDRSL